MPEKSGYLCAAIVLAVSLIYMTDVAASTLQPVSSNELKSSCIILRKLVLQTQKNICDKTVKDCQQTKYNPKVPEWMTPFNYTFLKSTSRGKIYKRGARQLSWFNGILRAIIIKHGKDVEEFKTPLIKVFQKTTDLIDAMRRNGRILGKRVSKRSALPYKFEASWAGKSKDEKLIWTAKLLQEMDNKYLRWITIFFNMISKM